MSFVVTKHPDYQAMKAGGMTIVPFLLDDLLDPDWRCDACHGEGYEFVPTWREEWEKLKNYPPRGTGKVCPKCNGKGNVSSWAAMQLLWEIIGRKNGPHVEEWMRGKHVVLVKLWQKWGEQHGYLLPTPDDEPSGLAKVGRMLLAFLRLWGS